MRAIQEQVDQIIKIVKDFSRTRRFRVVLVVSLIYFYLKRRSKNHF